METTKLKRFAQYARRTLLEQVEAKMDMVLASDSAARRENTKAVQDLEKQIKEASKEHVIEKVAYTWFNRFCALRFMDVNRYSRIGVVSPLEGQFQPEILAEAKMGHIDEETVPVDIRQQVTALLNGGATSRDPQQEAYRLLVVAACNDFHRAMPYLFERIADYTELLMPDDLLSGNAILAYTREAMTPDTCEDVEVLGWLYQFYISEKKDEVFSGLKKSGKIDPEDIPAATQLFTPHYIVRYLVENSLGRLWLLNRPNSRLADQMDYYIKPAQPETNFLHISKPEDIKVCDPACGSGHMLTYAFDLLYAIYEEAGTDPAEIPEKILKHNLYGIEIDERAGELAAFALTMKARAKQRRFFNKRVQPNICVLKNVEFVKDEMDEYMDLVGRDLFSDNLRATLKQFAEADNFGSLIRPALTDVAGFLPTLEAKDMGGQLFLAETHRKVLIALRQADYLSPKYHVVVANPPYMGGRSMNGRLGAWAKDNYPDSKSDLFAMFIERNLDLVVEQGAVSMITMQSWMFLTSFERFRENLLNQITLVSMAHLGARAFDSIGGEVVQTTAFVLENAYRPEFKGGDIRLVDGNSEAEKAGMLQEAIKNPDCGWFYRASTADFRKIPGNPIAYWVSKAELRCFDEFPALSTFATSSNGVQTGNNDLYVRAWSEVSKKQLTFKWFPYNKGGRFRKWYGNLDFYVDWENNGERIKAEKNSCVRGEEFYLQQGITWSDVTSGKLSGRLMPEGCLFDASGPSAFFSKPDLLYVGLALLNTKFADNWSKILNPTLHFQSGDFRKLTLSDLFISDETIKVAKALVEIAKADWNAYETSWDFINLPLLESSCRSSSLKVSYDQLSVRWREQTLEMKSLEEENHRIFIDAYGLQDERRPDVSLSEITLTCNPHYRYGGDKTEAALEVLVLADTMKEFISYAVGCMFGRYSLDKPGLILADQGETLADYLRQVPDSTFPADADNVIPILDGDWFTDDMAERFRSFLRATFGGEHYEDNLQFIVNGLNVKNKKDYTLREYFLSEFYNDHIKRYKKRPIYWLFSSPKGTFNALIYMHRYRPDTVSVVLNDYLREFRTKLAARKSHLDQVSISGNASVGEKTKALKEIEDLKKNIAELESYERDVLYPLATEQKKIDLDMGVRHNYGLFGAALKKIVGLDATED
jgi:type II restriction/modification system DNA methylase subunit YeeA